jgi:hypothetical protein
LSPRKSRRVPAILASIRYTVDRLAFTLAL